MKYLALATTLCTALAVQADPRAPLYGLWGTPQQCAQAALVPGGTKRAEPFDIRATWLRHGDLWCRLSWFAHQTRDTGIFAPAYAQCGEDSVQGYRLDFLLKGGKLTLIWNESLRNGPLAQCAES